MGEKTTMVDPYESRLGARWEAVKRADPAVWGSQPGPLNDKEREQFDEEGYIFRKTLFAHEEVESFLQEASGLKRQADPKSSGVITEPANNAIRSIFRVHRHSGVFRRLCKDERLVGIIRQLLGSEVYIHQSRINYKPAFNGKEFFWHSDFETWHIEDGMPRMRAVSVSVSFTESNEFNGPLIVIPRSHRTYIRCAGETPEHHYEQSLKKQEYGVPSREALQQLVEQGGMEAPKGPEGSALFFECNTMHGSVGNLSPFPRINLFVVYNSVENALVEPFGGMPPRPDFLAEREVIPISEL